MSILISIYLYQVKDISEEPGTRVASYESETVPRIGETLILNGNKSYDVWSIERIIDEDDSERENWWEYEVNLNVIKSAPITYKC